MTTNVQIWDESFKCLTDLSSSQYYLVKNSGTANIIALCNGTADQAIGVLQNKPDGTINQTALVRILGKSLCVSAGNVAAGNVIGPAANGKGTVITPGTTTTAYALGWANTAGTNANDVFEIVIGAVSRAA